MEPKIHIQRHAYTNTHPSIAINFQTGREIISGKCEKSEKSEKSKKRDKDKDNIKKEKVTKLKIIKTMTLPQ
jgi:hypothetical protein